MLLKDAVETLVNFILMMEHLPRGGAVSPPLPGATNWVDWLNTMGREMYLHHALEKLNTEYPPESDCDFLTHRALKAMVLTRLNSLYRTLTSITRCDLLPTNSGSTLIVDYGSIV